MTDAGLKGLAPLQRLRELRLLGTAVTDGGVKDLAALANLTTLYMSDTKITDVGEKELRKALPRCAITRR